MATSQDIERVAELAHGIWNEHFVPIIGENQVTYMLEMFQSAAAVAEQIRDQGFEYYLVGDGVESVGYLAIVPNEIEHSMQLNKFYLRRSQRGRGLGATMMAFVEEECTARGIRKLWLTVNKRNTASIDFYKHAGFVIDGPVATDIGDGFVMDDYCMQRRWP